MKQLIRFFQLLLLFGIVSSCSVEETVDLNEEVVRPQDQISTVKEIKDVSRAAKVPVRIIKAWDNIEAGESYFVMELAFFETVYEKQKGSFNNEIKYTFRVYGQDDNFVYTIDDSRGVQIALPIWKPGEEAYAWIRWNSGDWSTWRGFIYSECITDSEKPKITPNPLFIDKFTQLAQNGFINITATVICQGYNEELGGAPILDVSGVVRSYLNIHDNCDQELEFIQYPPVGTIFTETQTIYGRIAVIDNNNNETNIVFYTQLKICDNDF